MVVVVVVVVVKVVVVKVVKVVVVKGPFSIFFNSSRAASHLVLTSSKDSENRKPTYKANPKRCVLE
jgi:hypothetical protein